MEPIGTGQEEQPHRGFWNLWEVQRANLMTYCLGLMGGSEEEAKDAVSGTLLKALDAWDVNRDRIDNPVGWLFRIAHNHCMDQYREARHRYRTEADPDELTIRNRDLHPDLPESPEETFLRREMHVNLEDALAKLPAKLREVMILRCVKEYSYKEIADELALSEVNVRKRVQLGREWIRKYLDGYLQENKGTLPADVMNPGIGEKQLADSLVAQPYKDLFSLRNHCAWVGIQNKKGEHIEKVVYSHHSTRRLDQKIRAAEKYVLKYPSGWKKRQDLAELYFLSGQWDACLAQTAVVLDKNARMLEPRLQRSRIFLYQGDRRKAIEELRKGISRNPKPGVRYFLEGLIALLNKQYAMAARAFRKAVNLAPEQVAFKTYLGLVQIKMGDPAKALHTLNSIPPQDQGAIAELLRYQACKDLGAETQAQRILHQLLESFPNNLHALEQLALTRLQADLVYGDPGKETRGIIRSLGKLAPESAIPVALQAEYHFLRGKLQKSVQLLEDFLTQHPDSLAGRYHLARLHFLSQNPTHSLLALTAVPGLQSGRYIKGSLLDLFLHTHPASASSFPDSHDNWELLGVKAWLQACHLDQFSEAISSGEALLEIRSGWPASWYRKGWLDLISGRLAKAKSAWIRAWDLLPDGDGNPMRAGISKGMVILHSLQGEEKEAAAWHNRLEAWLPLLEIEFPQLKKALAKHVVTTEPHTSIAQTPLLYFLTPTPGLWTYDAPLI